MRLADLAAENGIRVVFGGEGADEWFTGRPSIGREFARGRFRRGLSRAQKSRRGTVQALTRSLWGEFVPLSVRRVARNLSAANQSGYSPFVPNARRLGPSATDSVPIWNSRAAARLEWRAYRDGAGAVIGWRDRHAFAPRGVDLRTPFNDLRIVNLMASTPDEIKQFRGRRKDILREAEYPVLPRSIPDRDGFGLYTELVDTGVGEVERSRVDAAIRSIAEFPGIDGPRTSKEVRDWCETHHRWWEPNWRAVTAGLWLTYSGVRVPGARRSAHGALPFDSRAKGGDSMTRTYVAPSLRRLGDIREMTQGELALSLAEGLFQKKPDPAS